MLACQILYRCIDMYIPAMSDSALIRLWKNDAVKGLREGP